MVLATDYQLYDPTGSVSTEPASITSDIIKANGVDYSITSRKPLVEKIDYFFVNDSAAKGGQFLAYLLGKEAVSSTPMAFVVDSSTVSTITVQTDGDHTKSEMLITTSSVLGTALSLKYYLMTYDTTNKSLSVINVSTPFTMYTSEITATEAVQSYTGDTFTLSDSSLATASTYYFFGFNVTGNTADLSTLTKIDDVAFAGQSIISLITQKASTVSTIFKLVPTETVTYTNYNKSLKVDEWTSSPLSTPSGKVSLSNNGNSLSFESILEMNKTPGTAGGGHDHISQEGTSGGRKKTTLTFTVDGLDTETIIWIVSAVVVLILVVVILIFSLRSRR